MINDAIAYIIDLSNVTEVIFLLPRLQVIHSAKTKFSTLHLINSMLTLRR